MQATNRLQGEQVDKSMVDPVRAITRMGSSARRVLRHDLGSLWIK